MEWDWEKEIMFSAMANEIPKNSQPPNMRNGIGEIDFGFPISYPASGKSDRANSSSVGEIKKPKISEFSADPILDLKLGKRAAINSSFSVISMASANPAKRFKFKNEGEKAQCCQVEGCNLDLSSAKHYHRKHRVCEMHSKCPKVLVGGLELRFCQQCSRFHGLSEFDAKKRSCRRRLSDHNWRRRKLQPEPVHYLNQARPSSLQINGAGSQESIFSSNVDASQNLHLHHRVLSLLSTNSWSSSQAKPAFLDHHKHKIHTRMPQPEIPQDLPLASAEYRQIQQQPNNFQLNNLSSRSDGSDQFHEFQLFREPYI